MAFLWGASAQQTEFDQLVEKCTSSLLPSSTPLDLPLALQAADLVRSSSVPAPSALKTLLPRLSHENPNVQLLALALADVLIKNGGTAFLTAFAKPAAQGGAATDLELLCAGRKSGGVNREVMGSARERTQEWAAAFRASGRKELRESELVEVVDRLKRDGVEFPTLDKSATGAMVESLSAPDWLDSPLCTRCRTPFSTFNRKHHCRNCGQVFDAACSSSTAPLPHYGITEPVRVCDACARRIKMGEGARVAGEVQEERRKREEAEAGKAVLGAGGSAAAATGSKAAGGGAGAGASQEDDDLRRAIEASLADSAGSAPRTADFAAGRGGGRSGYNPSYASSVSAAADTKTAAAAAKAGGGEEGEEEDPDLAAAIAASLRDLAPPASAPYLARSSSSSTAGGEGLTYSQMFPRAPSASYAYASDAAPPPPPPAKHTLKLPNYDLPPSALSLLSHFTSLSLSNPSAVHPQMYADVRAVEPQLERSKEDTQRRLALLREMEWKMAEAARVYGAGLVERAAYHSPSPARAASYAHPAAPVPPTPLSHAPLDPRYLPAASYAAGQPLPSYAVPLVQLQLQAAAAAATPQPLAVASPPPVAHQQQAAPQAPAPAQPAAPVPVPAGFYKPSQFPSVPQTLPPTALAALPAVPSALPREEEEEEEEEEEGGKVGELIEF
ncbi:hypothetical protein JCM10213_001675 [Rhodosporidiobolus nylandii]